MTVEPRASTLFLRLREPGSAYFASLALCAYYAATMARDLWLYDSGELALAAVQLGLGHPPGQPLHTMLGHALSWLPLPKLVGVGLASVLPAALTVIPATSLAQALCPADTPRGLLRALPWFIVLVALHVAFWEPATRVEVYVLAGFFAVWALARLATPESDAGTRTTRDVGLAGVALGLCASVHPIIAAAAGLAVAPSILMDVARKRLPIRAVLAAVGGGLLGMLPYAYVFIVAQRDDVMVWGLPRDAGSIAHYFLLLDYTDNYAGLGMTTFHMLAWIGYGAEHLLLPLCALGLIGHVVLKRRSQLGSAAAGLFSFGVLLKVAMTTRWNLEIPDYIAHVVPALWVLLAGVSALLVQAYCDGHQRASAFLAVCIVGCSLVATPHVFERTRHLDRFTRVAAERVLSEAPRNAIVIAEFDHTVGALLYLQEAEHARPDVVVLGYGLAGSSWHWRMIYRQHRALAAFALRGPGGKPGRVQRFLAAHPERPVLLERSHIAAALGVQACPLGLFLQTGPKCRPGATPDPNVPALLRKQLDTLGVGAAGVEQAIAATAYEVGAARWSAGHSRDAYEAFIAGVPRSMLPPELLPPPEAVRKLPRRELPMPSFGRGAALGDPARNLFVAALMLAAVGDEARAFAAMRAAGADGLPEAENALMQHGE